MDIPRKVYKYVLNNVRDIQIITLPRARKLLKVGTQDGVITLWYEVVVSGGFYDEQKFRIYGTGEAMHDESFKYLDTAFTGPNVWHIYEQAK